MGVNNCLQCGRPVGNCQGFTDGIMGHVFCSQGCIRAYKAANPGLETVVGGLIGKAIGSAVSGSKARRQEQAQQESYEQEQRRAEREERRRAEAEEEAAASAARHVITHEVVCPICDADVIAKMASDGETKVRCKQCKTRLKVEHDGDVSVLGPKDEELSKAESLDIKEDRLCGECKSFIAPSSYNRKIWMVCLAPFVVLYLYGLIQGWLSGHWTTWGLAICFVPGLIVAGFMYMVLSRSTGIDEYCGNKKAVAVSESRYCSHINPNLRCKFWEKA